MTHPVLYSFRRCPYAMRARMALDAAEIELEHREILLKDKPKQMLAASSKGTVPVLVLADGEVIDESLDVMVWALTQHDPENWLAHRDASLDLIERNDGPFKHALDRYKYPNRYEGVAPVEQRDLGLGILRDLDARISVNGCLLDEKDTLADIAIFPFIRQYAHTDKDWFDQQDLPGLHAWLEHNLASPRFQRIMRKHPVWVPDSE